MNRLVLALTLGLLLTLAVVKIALWAAPGTTPQSVNSGQHFLSPYANARDRFGFDSGGLTGYDVAQLHAGWYSNWGASLNPAHPDQLVYVQLIRFHAGADPHDPSQVTVKPSKETIAQIAAAHPGSLWFMSNEPDSLYQGDPILPEVYAVVYHDFYTYIKELDPTALIANGGIVQPTPCRLEYLDIVWQTYQDIYDQAMPVDVWNIHAFILREVYGSWGASTPPGVNPACGIAYKIKEGDDINILRQHLVAMRQWMKNRGYQDKPLIISEYGVLWPDWLADEDGQFFTPARVSHFMTQTFDLLLYETDPEIGYPADDYRLVQAWAWYSLSDDQLYNGYLFHSDSKTLSPMGEAYAAYTVALSDTLYTDLSARLVTARPSFTTPSNVSLAGSIGNLGKLPATDVLARLQVTSAEDGTTVLGHDAFYTVPTRFDGVVVLPPLTATIATQGRYELRLSLDPTGQIGEPRKWNNVASTTLDLRPDLASLDLAYQLAGPVIQSGTLALTATVHNQGAWPSPAVSASVYLEALPEGTLVDSQTLHIPPLNVSARAALTTSLTWSIPDHEMYHLILDLDEEKRLSEQNEDNNELGRIVPVVLRATLTPTATTVLTNASGAVQLVFPAGVVTRPFEIVYTPFWPGDWVTGLLKTSTVAFSLTAMLDGRPALLTLARPVSVTWRYSDADVAGLEEGGLRLFVQGADSRWDDAGCRPYQRDLEGNQLTASVCRLGRFVFGSRYDWYWPLILCGGLSLQRYGELALPVPEADWLRSPLRLPSR